MERLLTNIIKNYYWFLVAIAASLMFGVRDVSSLLILVTIAVAAISLPTIRWKAFDAVVFVYLLYSLCSYFFVEYTYSLRVYYLGVRSEMIPLLFYFIARGKLFKSDEFFENIRTPLFLAMACGVYLYFFQPYFYRVEELIRASATNFPPAPLIPSFMPCYSASLTTDTQNSILLSVISLTQCI